MLHRHSTFHPKEVGRGDLQSVVEPPVGDVRGKGFRLAHKLYPVTFKLGEIPWRKGNYRRSGDYYLCCRAERAFPVSGRTAVLANVVQLNTADAKLSGEDMYIGVAS